MLLAQQCDFELVVDCLEELPRVFQRRFRYLSDSTIFKPSFLAHATVATKRGRLLLVAPEMMAIRLMPILFAM